MDGMRTLASRPDHLERDARTPITTTLRRNCCSRKQESGSEGSQPDRFQDEDRVGRVASLRWWRPPQRRYIPERVSVPERPGMDRPAVAYVNAMDDFASVHEVITRPPNSSEISSVRRGGMLEHRWLIYPAKPERSNTRSYCEHCGMGCGSPTECESNSLSLQWVD